MAAAGASGHAGVPVTDPSAAGMSDDAGPRMTIPDGGSGPQGGAAGDAGDAGDAGSNDADAGAVDNGLPGSDRGCGPGSGSGRSDGSDIVRAYAETLGLATLEALVGQFVGGGSLVYRGTLQADANESAFGPGHSDQSIPPGPAIADLELNVDNGPGGLGSSLYIYSLPTLAYVQLQQPASDPDTTNVFMIDAYNQTGGQFGPCLGCAPSFASRPTMLDLKDVSGTYVSIGLKTTVSTKLAAVSPCTVTFADLKILNAPSAFVNFVPSGNELVAHSGGAYHESQNQQCGWSYPYSIDLFFDPDHPWVFGVRNYVASKRYMFCGE